MLGAIVGDIVGSIYEWNNHRSKDFPLFGPDCDFTDDTVCTVALADALLRDTDPARCLQDWCRRYPGRGYGGRFHGWIAAEDRAPYSSYGNAISIGGESDTVAAIAGSVAEGLFRVPEAIGARAREYLPGELLGVLAAMGARVVTAR